MKVSDVKWMPFEVRIDSARLTRIEDLLFLDGFNRVFPIEHLRCFNPHEVRLLLCGNQWPSWTLDDLLNYIEPSHGFTRDRSVFPRRFLGSIEIRFL